VNPPTPRFAAIQLVPIAQTRRNLELTPPQRERARTAWLPCLVVGSHHDLPWAGWARARWIEQPLCGLWEARSVPQRQEAVSCPGGPASPRQALRRLRGPNGGSERAWQAGAGAGPAPQPGIWLASGRWPGSGCRSSWLATPAEQPPLRALPTKRSPRAGLNWPPACAIGLQDPAPAKPLGGCPDP